MLIHFSSLLPLFEIGKPALPRLSTEYSATGSMTRSSLFSPSCFVSLRVGPARPSRYRLGCRFPHFQSKIATCFRPCSLFSTTCNHFLLLPKALIPPPLSLLLVYSKINGPSFVSPHRHSLCRYPNLPHAAARCDHTDSKLSRCK